MDDIKTIVLSPPRYLYGRDCGYCHSTKPDLSNGFSLPSLKEKYSKRDSKEPSDIDTNSTQNDRVKYGHYPNSITIGTSFEQLSIYKYEKMMDRGFRRSGSFVYRTDPLRSCCRMYAVRTNVSMFKATKEHRHAINKWLRFIGDDSGKEEEAKAKAGKKKGNNETVDIVNKLIQGELNSKKFVTQIEPAEYSDEKFELYKKYQIEIHHDEPDEVTKSGFKRFLCNEPFNNHIHFSDLDVVNEWRTYSQLGLSPDEDEVDTYEIMKDFVGAVHECYFIDEKLIAIGVLDILPNSVSSVYFIWDPEYKSLGLGTVSAIRELIMSDKLHKDNYYMGYYIGDCHKMKYKGKFGGEIIDQCSRNYIKLNEATDLSTGELCVYSKDFDNEIVRELEVTENFHRIDNSSKEYHNIADKLYGNGTVFQHADKDLEELIQIDQSFEFLSPPDESDIWKEHSKTEVSESMPLVVPGAISLWQMKRDLFDKGLRNTIECNTFQFSTRRMKSFHWDDQHLESEYRGFKCFVFDLIRLFGWEFLDNSVLIADN